MKTDREKLIELIEFGLAEWWEEHKKTYDHEDENEIPSIVDYLISKGVTIPVRCWECRYAEHLLNAEGTPYELCNINDETAEYTNNVRHPNGFCSYGERKEE